MCTTHLVLLYSRLFSGNCLELGMYVTIPWTMMENFVSYCHVLSGNFSEFIGLLKIITTMSHGTIDNSQSVLFFMACTQTSMSSLCTAW
jgi:hypothetical protein